MKKLFTLLTLLLGVVQSTYAQEPYAVLSNDNTTLTFYYDNNKASKGGMDVGPITCRWNNDNHEYEVSSGWYDQHWFIKTVVFDKSFADCTSITSTAYWFLDVRNWRLLMALVTLKQLT